MEVRTRFAPSPTGHLHVGGARTALFNYLYAKACKGKFILRIEDTDQERSSQESYEKMLESLKWLNLDYDEGPGKETKNIESYKQSERLPVYQEHVAQLIQKEKAYYCFCSSTELEAKKKQREAMGLPPIYDQKCKNLNQSEISKKIQEQNTYVVRFKTPNDKLLIEDLVQKKVTFDTSLIDDFIIQKSDKFPSYNFAVVIDDYLMNISHIIRGVGHLSNTPRQILIYKAFNWEIPYWAHVSEIVGSDHKKLSKRHGATSITMFQEIGYEANAFINYMALLGWSPEDGKEYIPIDKLKKIFDITRCSKSPSMFDVFNITNTSNINLNKLSPKEVASYLLPKSKLNWISNQVIQNLTEEEYLKNILPIIQKSEFMSEEKLNSMIVKKVLLALRPYLDYYLQIEEYLPDFFSDKFNMKDHISTEAMTWLKKDFSYELLNHILSLFNAIDSFQANDIKKAINQSGKDMNISGKNLFMTIRVGTTGKVHGLELPIYLSLLGKDKVCRRLETSLKECEKNHNTSS